MAVLDRNGPVPLYQQVAGIVQRHIDTGDLVPGDPVPGEPDLEADYGIARTTARCVTRELRARGLVHTIQGKGTFVGPAGIPLRRRKTPVYEKIAAEVVEMTRRGEIKVNRRIPGEKPLRREYGVAEATVRHAVAFLRGQGRVFTVPHRGTYVSPPEKRPRKQEEDDS